MNKKLDKALAIVCLATNTLLNPFAIPGYLGLGATLVYQAYRDTNQIQSEAPLTYDVLSTSEKLRLTGGIIATRISDSADMLSKLAMLKKDLDEGKAL